MRLSNSLRKTFTLLNFHRRTRSASAVITPVSLPVDVPIRAMSMTDIDELALNVSCGEAFSHQSILPSIHAVTLVPLDNSTAQVPLPTTLYTSPSKSHGLPAPKSDHLEQELANAKEQIDVLEADSLLLWEHNYSLSEDVKTFKAEIRILTESHAVLKGHHDSLKEEYDTLKMDDAIREEEYTTFKSNFYAQQLKARIAQRLAKSDQEKIDDLTKQLSVTVKFVSRMIDLGLQDPILYRTQTAVMAGQDPDEALVDAIKAAASVPGSAWSSIMLAVVGPRSSDNYISAINLTLKTRKELKHSKAVCRFWKATAKENPIHADTITPSSSNLSEIVETLSAERQTAMDDLLDKLRNGEIGPRCLRKPMMSPELPCIEVSAEVPAQLSHPIQSAIDYPDLASLEASPVIPIRSVRFVLPEPASSPEASPPSSPRLHIQETTDDTSFSPLYISSQPSFETIRSTATSQSDTPDNESICTIRPSTSHLAPLASQIFKQELIASGSIGRISNTLATKSSRPILGEIDLNRPSTDNISARTSFNQNAAKPTPKALGKRKALIVTESLDSITASLHSSQGFCTSQASVEGIMPMHDSLSVQPSTSDDVNVFNVFNDTNDTSNKVAPFVEKLQATTSAAASVSFIPPFTFSPTTPKTMADSGSHAAALALVSLEEICAGYGVMSLGSLDTIDEESETESRLKSSDSGPNSSTVSDNSVSDNSATLFDDHTHNTTISTQSDTLDLSPTRTPPSAKKSMLPVFKHFRRLSASLSPTRKPATPSVSVLQPTVSSSHKQVPVSPTKVPLEKRTMPLSIAKKSIVKNLPEPQEVVPSPSQAPNSPLIVSRIPSLTPAKVTPSRRMMNSGRRAVRTLSRIIS